MSILPFFKNQNVPNNKNQTLRLSHKYELSIRSTHTFFNHIKIKEEYRQISYILSSIYFYKLHITVLEIVSGLKKVFLLSGIKHF